MCKSGVFFHNYISVYPMYEEKGNCTEHSGLNKKDIDIANIIILNLI